MKRVNVLAIYLCLAGFVGCNQHEMDNLRAELIQARRATQAALKRVDQIDKEAQIAESKATWQHSQARKLRNEALALGKTVAQRVVASEAILVKALKKQQETRAMIATIELAEERAEKLLESVRDSRQQAATDLAAAKKIRLEVEIRHEEALSLVAKSESIEQKNKLDRTQLEQDIVDARTLIDEAEEAQFAAANARAISAEVNRLVAESRENRKVAEKAYQEAERVRSIAVAEKKAARAEQQASLSAIQAAEAEKAAAREAVAATLAAKRQIDDERLVIEQERAEMVLAKREAAQERLTAEKAISLAASAEARAKQARIAAARQQLFIAERLAVLDAAKEAAGAGERMALLARSTAVAERMAADNARTAAEQAQREAVTKQAFVRDIFEQLRAERFGTSTPTESVKETAGVNKGQTR
ncbi:MAG: hypothetical protein GXP26_01665 [Planctomycetes bacterium]|nr:hypothetical protein [Planctomycetota bacterium]